MYGLFVKKKNRGQAKGEINGGTSITAPRITGTSESTTPNKNRVPPAPETNIIDNEVGLENSLIKKGLGKAKGKVKFRTGASGGSSALAPRDTGISKPKTSATWRAAPVNGQQYYEANGIKIALYDTGSRKRHHARASTTFRNKNIEVALDIVESYAGSGKRHQFKNEGKSKAFIGDWIEMAETLAFGASPSTKLTSADWAASEFSHPNRGTPSISAAHSLKKDELPSSTDDDAKLEVTHSSLTNKRKRAPDEEGKRTVNAKQQKHDHSINLISHDVISANDTPVTGLHNDRRVPTNAPIPTPTSLTDSSAQKELHQHILSEKEARAKRNAESYILTDSVDRKRPGEGTRQAPTTQIERIEDHGLDHIEHQAQGSKSHTEASTALMSTGPMPTLGTDKDSDGSADAQEPLRKLMRETEMDPSNPETATKVFYGPDKGERLVVTVTTNAHGHPTLHQTTIPKSSEGFDGRNQTKPILRPFLKNGKHGAGGIFDDDPDRATGYGHDFEPEDSRNFEKYLKIQSKAEQRTPDGKAMFPDAVQRYKDLWPWYLEYTKQYPGVRLDQWPCGCLKLVDEDEDVSEEE